VSAPGIRNFGQVTPMLYRGGDFIPSGVRGIVHLGVKTVISLRSHSRHGEPDSCAAHGIAYYIFPMTTAAMPRASAMDSILDIIRNASAPVYVHCTAGEHRTGTVCALYRIRVQGWSQQSAWAEQEAYGFGPADHHRNLFHFVYGAGDDLKH
jgi:protein tyrosine/serine phosphatase